MEESTQRRERLKLMRLEASQEAEAAAAAVCNDDHSTTSLSNPLLESSHESQVQQSYSRSFNYYTDPMAAYSGSRQISAPPRSQTNVTIPSPSLQPHINRMPNPRMQQPPGQYANPNHTNISSPSWNNNSPHPGGYHGPGSVRFPNPQTHFSSSPGHGSGQGGYPSPRFTNNPGHGSGRGYPSPVPNFMNSPNHGPNQGRGHWFRNNTSSGPSFVRGTGRGRGRGGAHNHVSAEDRPDRFFNKSMVEDPWKFLEPVIWKSHSKQWFPQSLTAKKPRVLESPKQSSSQGSLAEILAASFNEAANDEPNAG